MQLLGVFGSFLQYQPPFNLPQRYAPLVTNTNMTIPNESMTVFHRRAECTPEGAALLESAFEALASKKPPRKSSVTKKRKAGKTQITRRGTILVVDDVPDVTEMIQLLLKHAGYDVSTAESAKDALRLARKTHYDLVISDIGMPDMNGYQLAEALRDLAAYNDTPLIAVTGYSEYDDRSRAVEAGFNVHLTKPIEPAHLLRLMSELLSQSGPTTNH
jgi:CheY-like chemotaxis protein